jgi:DNA-binding beta-propeller fold protein YncE
VICTCTKKSTLAGSKPAPGASREYRGLQFLRNPFGPGYWVILFSAVASSSAGADSYASVGFLKFPNAVEVGAVSAVAVDSADRIYVLHRGEPPLVAFDASGNFVRGWGQGLFKVPHGLRVDRDDNVWTTDNGNHVLRKFNGDGRLLATLGTEGKASGGKEGFRAPDDLVFDSRGNIYVADSGNGRIVKLTPDGSYEAEWGKKGKASGEFATAHGLAIDSHDRIYVADRGNQRVQVFDNGGKHIANWTGFGNPFGLLVVGEELLVSEGDIHKIFHLDLRDGKIVSSWGDPQKLLLPHLMAVNSKGRLFIAEVNGKRVQMFERREP